MLLASSDRRDGGSDGVRPEDPALDWQSEAFCSSSTIVRILPGWWKGPSKGGGFHCGSFLWHRRSTMYEGEYVATSGGISRADDTADCGFSPKMRCRRRVHWIANDAFQGGPI